MLAGNARCLLQWCNARSIEQECAGWEREVSATVVQCSLYRAGVCSSISDNEAKNVPSHPCQSRLSIVYSNKLVRVSLFTSYNNKKTFKNKCFENSGLVRKYV